MTEKKKLKSAAPVAKRASASRKPTSQAKQASAKTGKTTSKAKAPAVKPLKAKTTNARSAPEVKKKTKAVADREAAQAPKANEAKPKSKTPAVKTRKTKAMIEDAVAGYQVGNPVLDPIGDTTDGEGKTYTGESEALANAELEAFRADTSLAATDAGLEAGRGLEGTQTAWEASARAAAEDAAGRDRKVEAGGFEAEPREPARLERLQKILSQAGVASRRRAEEMITAGRVMVNGQVVTQLGSKADLAHDHIRVDGKLLHGAERHRYFVLNKPKGFVTTVSDPEGRPTVMQFFAKMHERVYPVGRLDFQSEGLLLMTNDGELANLLTKAESGVEKIYLVKVAGQPSEEELDQLRGGVGIEKGETGSDRVKTAPARIRQVRRGDNPWYEVALTEGRNRELRKMFASIGHFAEKIRRVGYGPLELDVEPGKMRELTTDEVNALRLTAEGRMKPRRMRVDRILPKEAGIPAEKRGKFAGRRDRPANSRFARPAGRFGQTEPREKKPWGAGDQRQGGREDQPQKKEWRPREFPMRGERKPFSVGARRERPGAGFQGERKPFGSGRPPRFGGQREEQRPFGGKPRFERPGLGGPVRSERAEGRVEGEQRKPFEPSGEKPQFERRGQPRFSPGGAEKRPFGGNRGKSFGGDRGKSFGGDRGKTFGADRGKSFGGDRGKSFGGDRGKSFGGDRGKTFGADRGKSFGGDRGKSFGGDRGKTFGGDRGKSFGAGGGKSFGGDRGKSFGGGSGKSFGKGPRFGAKPGGGGQFRSEGNRGRKPGSGRPGARPGGPKRG
jgi:23S rRNA pseudouridine2605 synthase